MKIVVNGLAIIGLAVVAFAVTLGVLERDAHKDLMRLHGG